MPQPCAAGQQIVAGRRGRTPDRPPPPQGDTWLRRVPGLGDAAVPCWWGSSASLRRRSFPAYIFFLFFFSLSPLSVQVFFKKKKPKVFSSLLFFSPCDSHAVERRGGGRGRNPSPSPPPWLLPRKRNIWGVSSPPTSLPSLLCRSAPQSRSRRRGARPPRGRGGPRTGPSFVTEGAGGNAERGGEQGRLRLALGRESRAAVVPALSDRPHRRQCRPPLASEVPRLADGSTDRHDCACGDLLLHRGFTFPSARMDLLLSKAVQKLGSASSELLNLDHFQS